VQKINPTVEHRAKKRVATESERIFGNIALAWWQQKESRWTVEHSKDKSYVRVYSK
jgi:hypothetical protein